MQNFHLNYEPLELVPNERYIVIDALYVNDIRENFNLLDKVRESPEDMDGFLNEIREKIFPYTVAPFAEFIPIFSKLEIGDIEDIDWEDIVGIEKNVCVMDTSILLFIHECVFVDFVSKFDYDALVGGEIDEELLSYNYWQSVAGTHDIRYTALLLGQGINSEYDYDFIGCGTYRIMQKSNINEDP